MSIQGDNTPGDSLSLAAERGNQTRKDLLLRWLAWFRDVDPGYWNQWRIDHPFTQLMIETSQATGVPFK